jgi:hypothetical protein
MKMNEKDYNKLLEKVDKVTKEKKLDLSSDEDLSIGIMNLISIEEHLFFTAQKTGKDEYYEMLNEVRQMRKEMLQKIIKEYEGEVWCISKHLLGASMRFMEVGTKQLGKGNKAEAKELFDKAYNLYSLFWALNLNIISTKGVKDLHMVSDDDIKAAKEPDFKGKKGFFTKMNEVVKKAIDCCKE